MLKRFFILISLALVVGFGCVSLVSAAGPDIGLGSNGLANQVAQQGGYTTGGVTDTTISQSIGLIIRVILSLVGTIFFVLTVYAGFLWMMAQGNEEQVTKATGILKMAVIGLIITLASYIISIFVIAAITGATLSRSAGGQPQTCAAIIGQNGKAYSCETTCVGNALGQLDCASGQVCCPN